MSEWYNGGICSDCACIPVCMIYSATGGVAQCRYKVNKTLYGEWIYKAFEGDDALMLYHCSLCDAPSAQMHPYCRACGAKMEMGVSLEDKNETVK